MQPPVGPCAGYGGAGESFYCQFERSTKIESQKRPCSRCSKPVEESFEDLPMGRGEFGTAVLARTALAGHLASSLVTVHEPEP